MDNILKKENDLWGDFLFSYFMKMDNFYKSTALIFKNEKDMVSNIMRSSESH